MVLTCLKYFLLLSHLKITLNLWSPQLCRCIKKMMGGVLRINCYIHWVWEPTCLLHLKSFDELNNHNFLLFYSILSFSFKLPQNWWLMCYFCITRKSFCSLVFFFLQTDLISVCNVLAYHHGNTVTWQIYSQQNGKGVIGTEEGLWLGADPSFPSSR